MSFWILVVLGIYFVQTLLPPLFRYFLRADPQVFAALGPRDAPPETSVYGQRADRALRNSNEQLLLFLPLALLAYDAEGAVLGAQIFALSRLAYVPVYILGVPVLRSLIFAAGLTGCAIMAATVLG